MAKTPWGLLWVHSVKISGVSLAIGIRMRMKVYALTLAPVTTCSTVIIRCDNGSELLFQYFGTQRSALQIRPPRLKPRFIPHNCLLFKHAISVSRMAPKFSADLGPLSKAYFTRDGGRLPSVQDHPSHVSSNPAKLIIENRLQHIYNLFITILIYI